MANSKLGDAKKGKNDEFYTQYHDIEKEINAFLDFDPNVFRGKTVLLPCDDPEWSNFTKFFAQRFESLGLKKLISTSFAPNSKLGSTYQPTLFEMDNPLFDAEKSHANGKIFTLTRDKTGDGVVNVEDLDWSYLSGDGDFRSDEVKALRDESDIIITNPPFSLFRDFLAWIVEVDKRFLIIGNINCITYKEVFPLIMENKAWLGNGMGRWISGFIVPDSYELYGTEARLEDGQRIVATNNALWLTNLDHGKRHEPLALMTEAENIRFSKHAGVKHVGYQKYENYDAIEVPKTDAIPSDYTGAMGVPITFLGKYNPDQFEILGCTESEGKGYSNGLWHVDSSVAQPVVGGNRIYKRIFIKHKKETR